MRKLSALPCSNKNRKRRPLPIRLASDYKNLPEKLHRKQEGDFKFAFPVRIAAKVLITGGMKLDARGLPEFELTSKCLTCLSEMTMNVCGAKEINICLYNMS